MKYEKRGFTMLEMLVALAITIVIVLFINQIMSSVKDAVSSGTSTSRVIQSARVVLDKLAADTENMLGPSGDGVLIITTATVTAPLSADAPALPRHVDQIAFLAPRQNEEPICFADDAEMSGTSDAPYVKIWYGHGLPVDADGNDAGAFGAGINQHAIDWPLCRQVVFLDPTVDPNVNHADTARDDAAVSGGSGTSYPGSPGQQMFRGFADVAHQTLDQLNHDPGVGVQVRPAADRIRYAYGVDRLRVNLTAPPMPFHGWRVSQMHAMLVPHVSDVTIDFAGDYLTFGEDWTSAPDTKLDMRGNGTIIWIHGQDGGLRQAIEQKPAWRDGSPQAFYDKPSKSFAWTKVTGNWPWLVRIRYRVHDPKGRVIGVDGDAGYQFERIIAVNRK